MNRFTVKVVERGSDEEAALALQTDVAVDSLVAMQTDALTDTITAAAPAAEGGLSAPPGNHDAKLSRRLSPLT